MVLVADLAEGDEAPREALADEAQDRREIVREDDASEPGTVDQPCRLENLLILLRELSCTVGRVLRDARRVDPTPAFVDVE